jgi:ubiquinone/menaquinone biosynthesis C-methylase UbiE
LDSWLKFFFISFKDKYIHYKNSLTMEHQLVEIREKQKESWNRFAPGWKKWDSFNMDFLRPIGEEIIRLLAPKGNDVVLDVAAGTGEPGLHIARMLDGGKVVITDLADHMLDTARAKAEGQGVPNVEFQACDACELPFKDHTFDAISCRMGFMFFPDMELAIREMKRVLKPGGRIAVSVWNVPEKNFWVTAIMSTIGRNVEMPAPPPGSPGMFRCAQDGLMTGLFTKAGLKNVTQEEVSTKMKPGTADQYWVNMTELGAPIVAALSKVDEATRQKIKKEVCDTVLSRYKEGEVIIPASALVIYGES